MQFIVVVRHLDVYFYALQIFIGKCIHGVYVQVGLRGFLSHKQLDFFIHFGTNFVIKRNGASFVNLNIQCRAIIDMFPNSNWGTCRRSVKPK